MPDKPQSSVSVCCACSHCSTETLLTAKTAMARICSTVSLLWVGAVGLGSCWCWHEQFVPHWQTRSPLSAALCPQQAQRTICFDELQQVRPEAAPSA